MSGLGVLQKLYPNSWIDSSLYSVKRGCHR